MIDKGLLLVVAGHEQVKHVTGLGAMVRHRRQSDSVFACPDIKQYRRHLERMRTGGGQQCLGDPQLVFKETVASFREPAVSRNKLIAYCLLPQQYRPALCLQNWAC